MDKRLPLGPLLFGFPIKREVRSRLDLFAGWIGRRERDRAFKQRLDGRNMDMDSRKTDIC